MAIQMCYDIEYVAWIADGSHSESSSDCFLSQANGLQVPSVHFY